MPKAKYIVSAIGLVAALALAALTFSRPEVQPVRAQSAGPEIAVYNQGVALVKDTRSLTLKSGTQQVTITDVASQIDPTSLHFRSITDPAGTSVLEQNFEYDLVGPERLLQKYVDQKVQVITTDGNIYNGTLLSGGSDIILKDDKDQVIVVSRDNVRDFTFPSLPEGLITKPSLVWLIDADKAGQQDVEITYMTAGLSWAANYVLLLSEDEKTLDLNGWVTLNNQSGATYKDAKLKLIAGDINRVETGRNDVMMEKAMPTAAAEPEAVQERSFFEYHLYEVQRPVTIKDNQTKQVEFVSAVGASAEKFFVYDGARGFSFWGSVVDDPSYGADTGIKQVRTMLSFNTGEKGINAQMPKGIMRVYKQDIDGSALLLGEDSIEHTPKDENVNLYIGDAFDIVGERVQTNFKRIGDKVIEETYSITLRNHKDTDVEVRVNEHLYRWSNWEITKESAKHTDLDSQTVEWRVPVKANGEATVEYTVIYSW